MSAQMSSSGLRSKIEPSGCFATPYIFMLVISSHAGELCGPTTLNALLLGREREPEKRLQVVRGEHDMWKGLAYRPTDRGAALPQRGIRPRPVDALKGLEVGAPILRFLSEQVRAD